MIVDRKASARTGVGSDETRSSTERRRRRGADQLESRELLRSTARHRSLVDADAVVSHMPDGAPDASETSDNALARLPIDIQESLISALDLPELRALALTCRSLVRVVHEIGWPALERRMRPCPRTLRLIQSDWPASKRATFAWCV